MAVCNTNELVRVRLTEYGKMLVEKSENSGVTYITWLDKYEYEM